MTGQPLMILVAGPYRSGTDGDPARIAANVAAMTEVSLELFRRGHLPVMGEWFALPLIEEAPSARRRPGAGRGDLPPRRRAGPRALRRVPADRRPVRGRRPDGRDRALALGKAVYHDIGRGPVTDARQRSRSPR